MRLTSITISGRPWAVQYAIWVTANDGAIRFGVDLHAAP